VHTAVSEELASGKAQIAISAVQKGDTTEEIDGMFSYG
jgi:hypothetical protein